MITDTGELVIVVDETHEEVPCDGLDCSMLAVRYVTWACGCSNGTCLAHFDFFMHAAEIAAWCECHKHGRLDPPWVTRTWPVPR